MKNFLKTKNRLAVLEERREKLITLNGIHSYTACIHRTKSGTHPKIGKYTSLLLEIRKQQYEIYRYNRETNLKYADNIENAKNAMITLTKDYLRNLTEPII